MSRYIVHLARDSQIAFGRACLRQTRVPIECIADRFVGGESIDELATDYATSPVAIEWAIRAVLHAACGKRGGFGIAITTRLEDLVPLERT